MVCFDEFAFIAWDFDLVPLTNAVFNKRIPVLPKYVGMRGDNLYGDSVLGVNFYFSFLF